MGDLRFFYDGISQPSRAVWLLLDASGVKYEPCLVDLIKRETRTSPDFKAVSAARTIPAIDDNGFKLFESVAIMQYLVSKYHLPDHWYPSELKQRAKINEFLSWYHTSMHDGASPYFFYTYISPKFGGKSRYDKSEEAFQKFQSGLKMLEQHFLKETKFIHSDEISIADLLCACDLTQFWMTEEDVLVDQPRVSQWLSDVQSALSPHFDKVHKSVLYHREKGTFFKKQ